MKGKTLNHSDRAHLFINQKKEKHMSNVNEMWSASKEAVEKVESINRRSKSLQKDLIALWEMLDSEGCPSITSWLRGHGVSESLIGDTAAIMACGDTSLSIKKAKQVIRELGGMKAAQTASAEEKAAAIETCKSREWKKPAADATSESGSGSGSGSSPLTAFQILSAAIAANLANCNEDEKSKLRAMIV